MGDGVVLASCRIEPTTMKKTTMLLALLTVASLSLSQVTVTVKEGETLGHIAARYGLVSDDIARANGLGDKHLISIGQVLVIPAASNSAQASKPAAVTASTGKSPGTYVVRNGDHDWAIARKFKISQSDLHAANPGVDWRRLPIGTTLSIPGLTATTSAPAVAKAAPAQAKTVPAASSGGYTVVKGDNDWIIARKLGTTGDALRAANPGVVWTRLQIGQKLNTPGGAKVVPAVSKRTPYMAVAKPNVIVRSGPGTNFRNVVQVSTGTTGKVLDAESGWVKLQFPKGTVGWVREDLLKAGQAPKLVASNTAPKATPDRNPGWSRTGRTNVALKPASKTGNALLDEAYSHLGTRYRYGASRSGAFDCSGFTSYVYKKSGVTIPRTSAQQATVGQKIDKGDLAQGDLVFFKTRGSRISHVGIYIGGGKFIHASSGGGRVKTDTLNSGYYQKRYAGARRVAAFAAEQKEAPAKPAEAETKDDVKDVPPTTETKAVEPPAQTPPPVGTDNIGK